MLPRFASLVLAAVCAAVVGCGSRTPLDGIDIYEDGEDGGPTPGASSGDPPSTSTGTPTDACPPVVPPELPPMLWYAMNDDLRNTGFYGGGLFEGSGEQTSFVGGVQGSAVEIARPDGGVLLNATMVPFGEVGAMTFTLWFEEPDPTGLGIPIFSNRSGYHGLQFYRGVYPDSVSICWGGIYEGTVGSCHAFFFGMGGWHQIVLRRTSDLSATEVFLDATLVETLPTQGFDLFGDQTDEMQLGDARIGEFTDAGRVRIDDVRLYDRALTDTELCEELGAFWCEPGCQM
jgi:hypothetical protein